MLCLYIRYCTKFRKIQVNLLNNKNFLNIQKYGLKENYINALSKDFAVSREVILHRLWDLNIISKNTYFDTLNHYSAEYEKRNKNRKKSGFITQAIDKGTQVGKLYTKTVISAYHAEKITPREASNYLLGLRLNHFGDVERWCY